MKIALCMSGHARTFAQTFEGWRDNLLAHHDVDIFFHLWDTIGPREMGGGLDGKSGVESSPPLDLNHLISIWHPKSVIVDNYKYYHARFEAQADRWYKTRWALGLRDIDRPLANFSMYYKWWACNNLKNEYAKIHDVKYDLVIRSRPDIQLTQPIPIEDLASHTEQTYVPVNGSWGPDEISDYMTIGTNEQIDHWCRIYEMIDEKYERALADGDFTKALYPHKLFYYHFIDYNQAFKQVNISCEILR